MSTQPTDQGPIVLDLSKLSPAEMEGALPFVEAVVRTLSNPETMFSTPTTADLGAMAGELKEHFAVPDGPDGPIREPGDDMPSRSDIYSDGELCMQLDRHRSRLVKLGMYDIAADLNYAVDEITDQADTIERLSKTIRQLAAEKVVAQNWITNLRATNASYMEQIAEQNAKLAEVGK